MYRKLIKPYHLYVGVLGECLACVYLALKGYTVDDTRWKNRFGELDIVARKKDTVFIIEVKTRKIGAGFLAREAIDDRKLQNIKKCANSYLDLKKAKHMRLQVKNIKFLLLGVNYKFIYNFIPKVQIEVQALDL